MLFDEAKKTTRVAGLVCFAKALGAVYALNKGLLGPAIQWRPSARALSEFIVALSVLPRIGLRALLSAGFDCVAGCYARHQECSSGPVAGEPVVRHQREG